jgi:arabinan endo-1,5-alpha-L-arabinosidase
MPKLPPWARAGKTWAPDVAFFASSQRYNLYFAARDRASNRQCIGVATSDRPEGPFASNANRPVIAQIDHGGAIDPFVFHDDDGSHYLLWKNDGNAIGRRTWISIQKLSADGTSLESEPRQLLTTDQAWEGTLVEAPTLVKRGSKFYLFYSANDYGCERYGIGYAVSDSLLGPYTKPQSEPLMKSAPGVCGPGGQTIIEIGEETWLLYHSWNATRKHRAMHLARTTWEGDRPVVVPSSATQTGPMVVSPPLHSLT